MNPKYCCEVEPENVPDLVAVVRCKDCNYCEACDDEETAEPLIFDGLIWCELHEFFRKPDYYCGDAERKDGDGD